MTKALQAERSELLPHRPMRSRQRASGRFQSSDGLHDLFRRGAAAVVFVQVEEADDAFLVQHHHGGMRDLRGRLVEDSVGFDDGEVFVQEDGELQALFFGQLGVVFRGVGADGPELGAQGFDLGVDVLQLN